MGDGGLDRDALLHLGKVDETFEIHREAEIAEHGFGDAGVAAGVLLVAFHHRGGDVEILRVSKAPDGLHRRIGLKAELRTEPRAYVAVMVEVAAFVPDTPEMHVA